MPRLRLRIVSAEGPVEFYRMALARDDALDIENCRDLLARHDVLEVEVWRLHQQLLEYEGGI